MTKNAIIPIVVIVILAIAGGLIYLAARPSTPMTPPTPPTTTPTPLPTPTPPTTPPQASVPTVQTDSNAVPSNSTVVVNGKVNPNGAPTTYSYEYGETTSFGTRTAAQAIGSSHILISSPAYITGLKTNTTYFFRLTATNRLGTVNGTMYSFKTNTNPPPQGSAPAAQSNTANGVTRTEATLHGQVNPKGLETTYWFEYGTSNDLGNTTAFQSTGGGTNTQPVSVALSGLNPLTKYYFRVTAQNQLGTVTGQILSFTTLGPLAPAAPTIQTNSANNIATSSAMLRGTINPNGASTEYWFEYSSDPLTGSATGSATPSKTLASGTTATSVSMGIGDLNRNTTYFFRLVGKNQIGTVRGNVNAFKTRSQ